MCATARGRCAGLKANLSGLIYHATDTWSTCLLMVQDQHGQQTLCNSATVTALLDMHCVLHDV